MKKITSLLMILFTVVGFSQDYKGKIQTYLSANKDKLQLTNSDINDWIVENTFNSDVTGIENYHVVQRYQGIEIYRAITNFSIKNGEVFYVGNRFVSNVDKKINTTTPVLNVVDAITKANQWLNVTLAFPIAIKETINPTTFRVSNGLTADGELTAKLVYHQAKNNKLILAWDFIITLSEGDHIWSARVDASNGKILEKNDMIISCNFDSKESCGIVSDKSSFNSNRLFKDEFTLLPTQTLGGTFKVIPFNYVSPLETSFQSIVSPENATASPKGWNDANSLTGTTASLKYTYTRGNNVWARTCFTCTNTSETVSTVSTTTTANGYSPNPGSLTFDYPYAGTSVAATQSLNASVTNLFYMTNIMHDIWYQYGFNEANGNFQTNNYGRGGSGSDPVLADAQYGSKAATPSLNNSNFSTPSDGSSGTMRMFLWTDNPKYNNLNVTLPSSIAGNYDYRQNSFSPGHVDLPVAPAVLESDLILYNDGTPDVGYTDGADACSAAVNASAINGHIALIRRSVSTADGGSPCNFTVKVKNAQLAGAKAVIIYNNVNVDATSGQTITTPLGMSGADATITIPAVSVTMEVGQMLLTSVQAGTTHVKLQLPSDYVPFVNADGDFDNGVISHEYGHGISTRLSGGSACLNNPEQMGEGWSDWFALMLEMKPGDVGTTPIGIGNYVTHQALNGPGIRNYAYSTDMTVNPETFAYTNGGAAPMFSVTYTDANGTERVESHQIGEIWTTMLWDLAWAYIQKYGYNDDKYTGTGGNNKVMRLVLDAIKLEPCGPSFIDARDALIAADNATTGGKDYCMIWKVFARRGMGVNASSGDNSGDDTNTGAIQDQVADFTEPAPGPNCTLTANYFEDNTMINVYPNPSNGLFNLHISQFTGKVNIEVIDLNGRIVYSDKNSDFNIDKSIDISSFQTGIYILKLSGDYLNYSQKLIKK